MCRHAWITANTVTASYWPYSLGQFWIDLYNAQNTIGFSLFPITESDLLNACPYPSFHSYTSSIASSSVVKVYTFDFSFLKTRCVITSYVRSRLTQAPVFPRWRQVVDFFGKQYCLVFSHNEINFTESFGSTIKPHLTSFRIEWLPILAIVSPVSKTEIGLPSVPFISLIQ